MAIVEYRRKKEEEFKISNLEVVSLLLWNHILTNVLSILHASCLLSSIYDILAADLVLDIIGISL